MSKNEPSKVAANSSRKMAREPKAAQSAEPMPKRPNKSAAVLAMLQRPKEASLEQLVAATGWLPHTTRAALTGLKKKGHAVTSDKLAGGSRTYRVAAAAVQ